MNLILVTRFYPPDTGGGGIAAYARYAAIGLTQAGHHVRVISAKANHSQARQTVEGVDVLRITPPFSSSRWGRLPIIGRQVRFIRDLFYAERVRKTLLKLSQELPPDLVEYADIDAEGFFHPQSLCPQVVKLHTPHKVLEPYYTAKEVPYARVGIEWMEKKAILSARGVSSPSRYLAQQIAKITGLPSEAISYVPNFIDTNQFTPALDAGSEEEQKNPIVLYVGRLEPRKGALVFSEAIPLIAHRFPHAKFVFLGADRAVENGTSQKAELQRFFSQAGILEQVEFYGHDSPQRFLSFYQRATVFVLPSLFENSPYTLLEAMACGKACVVSRAGGMPEMAIDGESALFFEVGNPMDLAEKVCTLLGDAALRKTMGQAARQRAESEYSLPVGTEKTLAFYHQVISTN